MSETYHCPVCGGKNVWQEASQLWNLNKKDYVKHSDYMNDFYWCEDCDDEISHVESREDCGHGALHNDCDSCRENS